MADAQLQATVAEFLFCEARLLDAQNWRRWLELYAEDCLFWAPATTMRGGYTADPERELNFIYIVGRAGLEARVFRLETNSSMASTPPPRTCHLVTCVVIDEAKPEQVCATAHWQTVSFNEQTGQRIRSGSYEYVLHREGGSFRITRKKIFLLEHVIDGFFDFYMI
jgi:3-phenylpropionate/cinnamic acid dioxygenase small subunit